MSAERTEYEAKLRIADVAEFRTRLETAGGRALAQVEQHDTLYDFADRRLTAQDAAFRLRRAGRRAVVTYKGPPQPGAFKVRAEYESPVGDPDALDAIARALDLEPILSYRKTRETWQLGHCEVCLDSIPQLGDFIEIEGPDAAAIGAVLQRLGLNPDEHLSATYPQLLATYCRERGIDPVRLGEARE